MRAKNVFRVLAALPLASASGRKILNGVHRFLSSGYDWDIELVRRDDDFNRLFEPGRDYADFDGMLVAFAESPALRKRQIAIRLPTVFVDYPDPLRAKIPRHAFVRDDEKSIAAIAAQHLLASGDRASFGYVPPRINTPWSEKRLNAFREKMKLRGKRLVCFEGAGESREALTDWLRALPKPAALLAGFDDRAVDVLEACRAAGLAVPDDIAVLGIGNDESICETTVPPLSSVAVDFEAQGHRAARELQALMLGGPTPRADIHFGARDVVPRASTPGAIPSAMLVERAMDYIRAHACRGISSRDVAAHLHVSRRLADLRFREARGESMLTTITACRVNEVKRLLGETNLRLNEIAERCGYRNADVLRVLFTRQTGLSPRAWRQQRRGERGA